jgi:hypothetical protein
MLKFILVTPAFDVVQEILHGHRFVLIVQLHFHVAKNGAKLDQRAGAGWTKKGGEGD